MALCANGFPLASRGLSSEQEAKIQMFKRILQQSGAWDDRCFDDHDCARFLKARSYDIQAAKQMWDAMLVWRRENRVDTIRNWFVFNERKEYDRVFPTGLHKTDNEGHPVLIQQLGRVNIGALYKVTTDDRIRLAHIAENEHLRHVVFPACSRAAGRPIDQLFTIIDLEGVAFTSMMRTTSLLKMFMTMDSNNYPETLAHMAIINAPGWFSTSWGAVKSVLSGDTVRKIEILGKDYHAALLRHIPRDNLLVEYGGQSRGSVTDNEGPWQEEDLQSEPPASAGPVASAKLQTSCGTAIVSVAVTGVLIETSPVDDSETMELSVGGGVVGTGGDQKTPRDTITRRSQSPLRPGAKQGAALTGASHHAPQVTPPLAKRPHHEELQLQALQGQQQQQRPAGHRVVVQPHVLNGTCIGSPAASLSDSASDSAQNMTAPLMSNFLSSNESPSPQQHQLQQNVQHQQLGTLVRNSSPTVSAGGAPVTIAAASPLALPRRSSGGGANGLVAGFVATLQAAVGHVSGHHSQPQATVSDGVALRPSVAGPNLGMPQGIVNGPQSPIQLQQLGLSHSGTAGPAKLLLSSPREDATGPGTLLSAASTVYSPRSLMSPLSPMDLQGMSDTASSRRTEGGNCSVVAPSSVGSLLGTSAALVPGPTGGLGLSRRSGGGASVGGFNGLPAVPGVSGNIPSFTGSGVSAFASAVMASGELLPGTGLPAAAATIHSGPHTQQLIQQPSFQSQPLQLQQPNDLDDAESVRISVMSQRSFYSALSHLDQSSCSGITSPNEASENARRWSMQRELHAAAIASAVAATAERRAAAAAAAAVATSTPAPPVTGNPSKTSTVGTPPAALAVGIPPACTLSGVSYIVPPATQQAFGSYLDQPPPYSALRVSDGSFTIGDGRSAAHEPSTAYVGTANSEFHGQQANAGSVTGHRAESPVQPVDAVAIHIANDSNGSLCGGGMSRSPSTAAIEDCSLGVGAVRWARGWFFRRRNYGRLNETEGTADGTVLGSNGPALDSSRQSAAMLIGRGKGSIPGAVVGYASMQDRPCTTSPSKLLPKLPSGPHHARGDSWEWDQPSPYDIDQTYGRSVSGSGAMHREGLFGRGGERRRLLRSESPGRRRGLGDVCSCLPCCTIM